LQQNITAEKNRAEGAEQLLEYKIGKYSHPLAAVASTTYRNYIYAPFKAGDKIIVWWDGDDAFSTHPSVNNIGIDKGVKTELTITQDTESINLYKTGAQVLGGNVTFYCLVNAEKEIEDVRKTKADKVPGAIEGHFASLDQQGNILDSGKNASDFSAPVSVSRNSETGNVKILVGETESTVIEAVDKNVTAGSNNPISGGAVEKATTKLSKIDSLHIKELNLSAYTFTNGYISLSSDKTWNGLSSDTLQYIIIPKTDLSGASKIKIISQENEQVAYAFLSSYNAVEGGDASVVNFGYVAAGYNELVVPVPPTANFLYFGAKNRNAHPNILPYLLITSDDIDSLTTLVDNLKNEGFIYKGIATASTNPGSQLRKSFYVAKEAGTYTNFSSLSVPNGISILKWNGSAWSLDSVLVLDESLSESKNPVQNKAIYEFIHQHEGELSLLKDAFDNTAKVIDLLSYQQIRGYISWSSGNVWKDDTSNKLRHIVIPVSDLTIQGVNSVKITTKDSPASYAWLSAYNFVVDSDASVILHADINANSSINSNIPNTAAYLYFTINDRTGITLPDRLTIGSFAKISDIDKYKADKGNVDDGTTYDMNNRTVSSRIGNAYPMLHQDDIYHIELTDVVVDTSQAVDARVYVSFLKEKSFTGGPLTIRANIRTDETLEVQLPEESRDSGYKYLGVYIYKSTDSVETQVNQSFHCKIYTKKSLADALEQSSKNTSDISELKTRQNITETKVSAIETAMTNVSGGQGGGNDCIFERRTILSTIPYYMSVPNPLSDYDSDQYLEQKVKKIIDSKKSFIFITDTHLYRLTDHSDPSNARKSDLLMSYIKKRCHINTGIFGGDCYDNEPSKYLGASVLSEYASEFFSVFAENGLWAQGNHDNNFAATNATDPVPIADALVSDYEAYMRTVKTIEDRVIFDEVGLEVLEDTCGNYGGVPLFPQAQWWFRMHYYKDDVNAKIRYIILESGDESWANIGLGKHYGALWYQMDFVVTALNTIPEGYDAVIAFHMCGTGGRTTIPSFDYRYTSMIKLLSAYKTKSSVVIDVTLDTELASKDARLKVYPFWQQMNVEAGGSAIDERTFNFANHRGSGKIVCITGHFHNDAVFAGMTLNGTYGVYRVCEHNKADVPLYSNANTYTSGDEVVYDNKIYANAVTVDVAEEFDATKWIEMVDKDTLPSDAVYMLWREQDAYASNYPVKSIKNASRTINTITEQAFDVFTLGENSINIVKIGGGEDIELPI